MSAALFVQPWRPLLEQGVVAPGGKVWFTQAGTDIPLPVYTDGTLTTLRTNPVQADGSGRVPATYLDDSLDYRVRIYPKGARPGIESPLEEYDPYTPGAFADPLALAEGWNPDETIHVKDLPGIGTGTLSAAVVTAAIDALPGTHGARLVFPTAVFDDTIHIRRPCILEGYGEGTSTSGTDASANTLLTFPAGKTGFRIHTGGQNTIVKNMRIKQASYLTTSQTGSFTSGVPTITLSAAGDFQNGQIIQVDGAGHAIVLPDRVFSTTNGSPVVTWTYTDGQFRGNSIGYVGQPISLAGFAAGTKIVSWGIGTATLSNNASATASGLTATITTPMITEIVSGGGTTTLTIADLPFNNGTTVTGAKVSHAAPAIYSTIQCHARDFEAFCQVGMVLAGTTTGGNVADLCSFINSYFLGVTFGFVLQGTDSQVNTFYNCNFAGPEIGVLDQSFIENDYVSCHWAFNCGIMAVAAVRVFGGYMEGGTSYISGSLGSFMLGTQSFIPGSGFGGFGTSTGKFGTGPLDASGISVKSVATYGGGTGASGYASYLLPGSATAPWTVVPGNRINMIHDGTRHWHFTSDPWRLDAVSLEVWNNGLPIAKTIAGGWDLFSGKVYSINGTQVLGPRVTGWVAATNTKSRATFDTTTVTLPQLAARVAQLIDDLMTSGPIGT